MAKCFLRSCMEDGFTAKSGKNQEKKGFSKRIILRKESMIFDFFENKTIFGRGPKRRLVKESQDEK